MSITSRGKNTWRIEVITGKVNRQYQRITETFHGLKSEAKNRESELKKQSQTGTVVVNRKMTFSEFSEIWLKEYAQNLAPRTYKEYTKLIEKINNCIGNIPLIELKPLHLTDYYNQLREKGKEAPHNKLKKDKTSPKTLSENTILHHYTLIGEILNRAVDWDCLERNPNTKVPRPKIQKHEPKFYDTEQVQNLLKCLETEPLQSKALILLALDTGARRGEITGLDWSDIDFEKNFISINQTTQMLNGEIIEKVPKTNSSIRKVAISAKTAQVLKAYKKEQLMKELELGSKWEKTNKVFTGRLGGAISPSAPSRIFSDIIKRYNLPSIKFHELRHTSVSLLINSGIHTHVISKRVGHSSISTTSSIYSHIFNSAEKEVAEKMNNILKAT
ncbi:MAG: site-specific integrase [Clostridia bacterium]|nr:site-specific integrase [Clostridia bacterium]